MNKQKNLVSVIIPIYNAGEYLKDCINSVVNQTYKNLEIILVDDGSTDICPQICDEVAKKDGRVKVIHKKNEGLVAARKSGLKLSTGDYIAYVDADDFVDLEMYETMMDAVFYTNADVIAAGYKEQLDNNNTEILKNTLQSGVYSGEKLKSELFSKMIYNDALSNFGIPTYLWNKLFKRETLYKSQMNVDERISIGEDGACLYPALLEAEKICITDTSLYNYRQHISSMMKSSINPKRDFERLNLLYEYLKQAFTKHKEIMLPQLDMYMLSLATVFISGAGSADTGCIFPFSKVRFDSKFILCGAGTFGQHLYRRFENINVTPVRWVDTNFIKYARCNLPVYSLESLIDESFDYVIVAYINPNNANRMIEILKNLGIPEEKIVWLDYDFKDIKKILQIYGFNTGIKKK